MTKYANPALRPPLEERFYSLSSEEFTFFKSETHIDDEDAMKEHIIAVQTKAYNIYGYPCIRFFSFTKLKISRLPAYQAALQLKQKRPNAILLDIGCCFGNDIRKAVADGWPAENAIGSDLRQGFWDFGHELFISTPKSFPVAFVAGDAFDSTIIAPRAPFTEVPETPRPDLKSLVSLTPLQGHISVIHASSFFHLFDEARQLELAKRVATLLSPLAGSIIFGSHIGKLEKGLHERHDDETKMFCHSPESWQALWDGEIFDKGQVKVDAILRPVERPDKTGVAHLLIWSVTRQ